jgi:hypothetical protein
MGDFTIDNLTPKSPWLRHFHPDIREGDVLDRSLLRKLDPSLVNALYEHKKSLKKADGIKIDDVIPTKSARIAASVKHMTDGDRKAMFRLAMAQLRPSPQG